MGSQYTPYAFVVSSLWPEPLPQPSAVLFQFVSRCYEIILLWLLLRKFENFIHCILSGPSTPTPPLTIPSALHPTNFKVTSSLLLYSSSSSSSSFSFPPPLPSLPLPPLLLGYQEELGGECNGVNDVTFPNESIALENKQTKTTNQIKTSRQTKLSGERRESHFSSTSS